MANANANALLSLCFLANFILVINDALVNSNGLKLRMTHSYSLESHFLQNNITHEQRIIMLASQSNIRTNHLSKTSPSTMHADVYIQRFHYIVSIGVGTFKFKPPYKEYYLDMDTGSDLVWLQCEGCTRCFKQTPTPFPKDKSSSFRPILRQNKPTLYESRYSDGDNTRGMLAHETFYLKTKKGETAKIDNVQFGCGLDNKMEYGKYKNNKIAGIMGLGWGDNNTSLVKQLGPQTKGRFSYCLPVLISRKTPSTYLRFGDDHIPRRKNIKSTPLYRRNKECYYYVEMQGISINKMRLNISQTVFAFNNNDGKSGCIIDTGTAYSRIITPAFRILKLELEKYFSRLKGLSKVKGDLGLELCYDRSKKEGFRNLPDITFHLQGSRGEFVLKAEAAFEVVSSRAQEYFCLAIVRDNEMSIIGAHQQTNHRMIHDTRNKQLMFYPEDCSKNP